MGSNFFIAFRVLPPERRSALSAVYRFCRRADDAVDHAASPAEARDGLREVREELDAAFGGAAPQGASELRAAVERFDLPRTPFDELLEGVSWDIDGRRYEDSVELREYCHRVASTVGLLCVRIFGCGDGTCDRYARELGIALQWTNILRDVGTDLARGRVYLTRQALRRHELRKEDLRRGDRATRVRLGALVADEAEYARTAFDEADRSLPDRWRGAMLAGEIMAGVYRRLLCRVDRAGGGVLDGPVRVSRTARVWVAVRALARNRWRYGFRGNR